MSNFFKEIIRVEPHTIEEVRTSLDTDLADHKQFIPLLKEHHDYLQESIAAVLDKDSTDFQKQEHLERFFRLVEMHGKAEQEVLYAKLIDHQSKEARLEGLGGLDEHALAFQLEDELTQMGYKNEWTEEVEAKAKIVVTLVKNHIKEEEDTMFTVAESHMTEEELEQMRDAYIAKCKNYLTNKRAETIYAGTWNKDNFSDKSTDIIHH